MKTTSIFLPGKSHGQRRLVGYSPWGHKRLGHILATKQQQPMSYSNIFRVLFLFIVFFLNILFFKISVFVHTHIRVCLFIYLACWH